MYIKPRCLNYTNYIYLTKQKQTRVGEKLNAFNRNLLQRIVCSTKTSSIRLNNGRFVESRRTNVRIYGSVVPRPSGIHLSLFNSMPLQLILNVCVKIYSIIYLSITYRNERVCFVSFSSRWYSGPSNSTVSLGGGGLGMGLRFY